MFRCSCKDTPSLIRVSLGHLLNNSNDLFVINRLPFLLTARKARFKITKQVYYTLFLSGGATIVSVKVFLRLTQCSFNVSKRVGVLNISLEITIYRHRKYLWNWDNICAEKNGEAGNVSQPAYYRVRKIPEEPKSVRDHLRLARTKEEDSPWLTQIRYLFYHISFHIHIFLFPFLKQ